MNKFLLICIPVRLLLAYVAYALPPGYLPYLSLLTIIIGLGFMANYLFDLRPNGHIGPEGKIWWNAIRPVHAALYIMFSAYAYKGAHQAYAILVADALLGLIFHLSKDKF